MIHEVSGDILLTQAKAIAHGISPDDPFNQGLALALRERWPAMVKDFHHYCHNRNPKPGEVWSWAGPGLQIINLLTQEAPASKNAHPGKATLSYVRHSLDGLRKFIENEGLPSVALPKLATGVGGLSWNDVKPLIQEKLGDLKANVLVYSAYHPNEKAKEPI